MWVFVLKSGIHATLAGVVLALFIPYKVTSQSNANEPIEHTPLKNLEHSLHSWVAFLILPIFVIGIYPAIITEVFESGINPIFERFTF